MTKDKTFFITGGSGFFGEILKKFLLAQGARCINIDLEKDYTSHKNLYSIQGDIRDRVCLDAIFKKWKFDAIFHCAAILAHEAKDKKFLWESNVDGTRNICEYAKKYKIPKVIFVSSNCLWAKNFHRQVMEDDVPRPVEIYGKSKWEGEKILMQYQDYFDAIIFRSPTIMDAGRLGLLSILFEFIIEGRKVWVIGGGKNTYQFIYAQDLVDACVKAHQYNKTNIFNIGSDHVKTFHDVYQYVIDKAGTNSRIKTFPRNIALPMMKLAHILKISPLGPYQYKMIAEDFIFNTEKIKQTLGWHPTLTNEEMLYKAYEYYKNNLEKIKHSRDKVSAHKQEAKMGIIKLLKWLS